MKRGSAGVRANLLALDARLFPSEPQLNSLLRGLILSDCISVLDVGCGDQGALLRRVPGIPRSVGVDSRVPDEGSSAATHSSYFRMDVRDIGTRFDPASFDCVVATDVIEHLTRTEGFALLEAMERIAAIRVVVFTPNGFLPQSPAPDNPLQEHISGWRPDDFHAHGYRVVGVNGWKPLRGEFALIRFRPAALWRRLSVLSQRVVASRPRHAFQLLAIKDTGDANPEQVPPQVPPEEDVVRD